MVEIKLKPGMKFKYKVMAINIELIKSLNGRSDKQVATANSLGLRKIGDKTCQPDNPQTKGKVKVISHLIKVTEA